MSDISNCTQWREAADQIIADRIAANECFSSGEIAAKIRTDRPDLAFSVTGLGNYVRDKYFNSQFPAYPTGQPVQATRYTTGKGRTPAGQMVFVYGPEVAAADAHDFEVDIPAPGIPAPGATSGSTPAPAPKTPKVPTARKPKDGSLHANLWDDGRLAIPRHAIDAFLAANGTSTQPDTKVWVKVESDRVVVTLDEQNGARELGLWAGQGRLAVKTSVKNAKGKVAVTADREALVVDLLAPV